jgi:hypothetical protein
VISVHEEVSQTGQSGVLGAARLDERIFEPGVSEEPSHEIGRAAGHPTQVDERRLLEHLCAEIEEDVREKSAGAPAPVFNRVPHPRDHELPFLDGRAV